MVEIQLQVAIVHHELSLVSLSKIKASQTESHIVGRKISALGGLN